MRLLEIVLSHRTEAAKYHDHKEKTAYGAAALYLAATAAWALNTEFWKDQSRVLLGFSAVFLIIAAVLVWTFIGWQLRNREDAARIEGACVNVMARIAAGELNADQDVTFDHWDKIKTLLMPKPIVAEGQRIRDALHDEIATHVLVARVAIVLLTLAVLVRIGLAFNCR
jgi:hypothetical protein